jgi:hypothetical protein
MRQRKKSFSEMYRNSELNFRGRVTSDVSALDVQIGTSDLHRWRIYLNTKGEDLVSLAAGIIFIEIIKTYETPYIRSQVCSWQSEKELRSVKWQMTSKSENSTV